MGTILIVDDDPAIRELIATVARAAGHEVICAANGEEAISIFRPSPTSIDIDRYRSYNARRERARVDSPGPQSAPGDRDYLSKRVRQRNPSRHYFSS
jgi:DNA-binding NarL/FixJ family response regulator